MSLGARQFFLPGRDNVLQDSFDQHRATDHQASSGGCLQMIDFSPINSDVCKRTMALLLPTYQIPRRQVWYQSLYGLQCLEYVYCALSDRGLSRNSTNLTMHVNPTCLVGQVPSSSKPKWSERVERPPTALQYVVVSSRYRQGYWPSCKFPGKNHFFTGSVALNIIHPQYHIASTVRPPKFKRITVTFSVAPKSREDRIPKLEYVDVQENKRLGPTIVRRRSKIVS